MSHRPRRPFGRPILAVGALLALLIGCAHPAPTVIRPLRAAPGADPRPVRFVVEPGTPQARVNAVRAAWAEAYPRLVALTGLTPPPLTVRLYRTLDRFLEDLKRTGEMPAGDVSLFRHRTLGSPRPILGNLFVPHDLPPREVICYDLVSAFFDALSDRAYRKAKWLDVGVSEVWAQRLCRAKSRYRRGRLFLPLATLATEGGWSKLREGSGVKLYLARGQAALVVETLLEKLGDQRFVGLLRELRRSSVEEALRKTLGLGVAGLEDLVRARHFKGFIAPPPLREVTVPDFPGRVLVQEGLPPARVEAVTRAYRHAHEELLKLMGRAPQRQNLRLFATRARFLEDLSYVAGMTEETVDFFRKGTAGAPRPIDGEFYVPPDMNTPGVCHELTHQFFEALAGDAYQRAKWLDEGLAEHFEHRLCGGDARPRPLGRFIPLARIASSHGWHELMEQGQAGPIYTEARLVVTLLGEKLGDARLVDLVRKVATAPLGTALEKTMGLTLAQLEQLARERFWTMAPRGPASRTATRPVATRPARLVTEAGVSRRRVKQLVALYARATSRLARHTGVTPPAQTLRIYRTREAMLRDLETVGGLPRPILQRFGKGTPPPPWKGHLYVPPEMTPPELCRLLSRVFVEERWPTYDWAMWLGVGYVNYLARQTCPTGAPWPRPRAPFVPLRSMVSKRDWVRRLDQGQFEALGTEALLVVKLLVERFGEASLAAVLADLYQLSLGEALRKNLHLAEEEIASLVRERYWSE